MPEIVAPDSGSVLVDEEGRVTDESFRWMQDITRNDPIVGTGSPEGVIDATVARFYVDDAGTAGSILYVKRDADVGGDTTKGWIVV